MTKIVITVVKEAAKIIEAGEVPEAVRYVVEVIRETEVFRFMKREIDAVFDKYPVEIETIKYVVTNVKETLERDIDVMIEKIMEIPSVQRIINWVMEKLTPVSSYNCSLWDTHINVFIYMPIEFKVQILIYSTLIRVYM